MTPDLGSRWVRNQQHDPSKGPLNHYTVLFITNQDNLSCKHPMQVVYRGDNGKLWSLPLEQWPGNLREVIEILQHPYLPLYSNDAPEKQAERQHQADRINKTSLCKQRIVRLTSIFFTMRENAHKEWLS